MGEGESCPVRLRIQPLWELQTISLAVPSRVGRERGRVRVNLFELRLLLRTYFCTNPEFHTMADDASHPESNPDPAGAATTPQPAGAPMPPRGVEDAGAQALSEALHSTSTIVKLLMAALVVAFILSGVFTVRPNQVAVKLRLGKPIGVGAEQLLRPGLHWKLPYPIDDVVLIPVGESHTVTSTAGWYSQTQEEAATGRKPQAKGMLQAGVDAYTLTGDGNIIHAKATMSYRISDPISYWFNFTNATNLLH